MSRILVVDDERDYCDELELSLRRRGHEVDTAVSGREAIDRGAWYRPDVLVADWMLKGQINGLHVSEVLRMIDPHLRTILITGFASPDLKAEAQKVQVFDFIEKPFDMEQFQRAVRKAARTQTPPRKLPIGVIEVAADGAIHFANSWARDLFTETTAGRGADHLDKLFSPDARAVFDAAVDQWHMVSPVAPKPITWHVRSKLRPKGEGRLAVLLAEEDRHQKHQPVVTTLLGEAEPPHTRWPLESHVLIIDGEERFRRRIVSHLDRAGCLCHAAETEEAGLELFMRDAGIKVVLVDIHTPGIDVGELAREFWAVRSDVTVIGTGCLQDRQAFTSVGVHRFLQKPWRAKDLINLMTHRIGNCVACGLPSPLRRPQPGETGKSWICCGCGARYLAVMDECFPPEITRHVRPAETDPASIY